MPVQVLLVQMRSLLNWMAFMEQQTVEVQS
jgi:hypothetical protein